jgi:hypothetical protein
MNPYTEIAQKFQSKLPLIKNWIDELLESNKKKATCLFDLEFAGINQTFPKNLLKRVNVVTVENNVPFPPLSKFGLNELSDFENMQFSAIAYKDTFFINKNNLTESLYFHEIVHVVQWHRLGVDDFLMAYAICLMIYGYESSPLERMAYSLQRNFEMGTVQHEIVNLIESKTDEIWNQFRPLIQ